MQYPGPVRDLRVNPRPHLLAELAITTAVFLLTLAPFVPLWTLIPVLAAWGLAHAAIPPGSRSNGTGWEPAFLVLFLAGAGLIMAPIILGETSLRNYALFIAADAAAVAGFRLWMARRRRNTGEILIVGCGPTAAAHEMILRSRSRSTLGFLATPGDRPVLVDPRMLLGSCDELSDVLTRYPVDEIHFAVPSWELGVVRDALPVCLDHGIQPRVHLDFLDGPAVVNRDGGTTMISFPHRHNAGLRLALKRAFDLIAGTTLLLLALPVMLVVAFLIRVFNGGPVLFRQTRAGRNEKPFLLYKFRSMKTGAPDSDEGERDGPFRKVRSNDPRITRLGRFLRRSSLDELPQLINVVRGEMSLIGPRPLPPDEAGRLVSWQRRRLRMRPGLSGLWQVSGRSDLPSDERLKLDTEYVDRWSLLLDARIFFKTIGTVLTQKGAR